MSTMVFGDVEQGSAEWLRLRAGILTASTVGQMLTPTGRLGSNDKTRALIFQLVTERITGEPTYVPPSWDMKRGTFSEPYARDLYSELYAPVTETGFMLMVEPEYRLGYSPDGMVGEDGLIEIKSPQAKGHVQTILADEPPAKYVAQLQTGLLVSGRQWIDYVSYCPGLPLYVKRVKPDEQWHASIREAATRFEEAANSLMADYQAHADHLHPTPNIDVFDGETYDYA